MNLIGKTVNITNVKLLEFFYPNFYIKDTLFFDQNNSIIYTGKSHRNLLGYLENNTKEFISTVGVIDIDLDVKDTLVNFVYDKFSKVPKEKTRELILNLQNIEFYNYIKNYWVSGISILDTESTIGIYDLFVAMGKSKSDSMKVYQELSQLYPISVIQTSVETFLEKVVLFPEISVNYRYQNLIEKFKKQHESKLKQVFYQYYVMRESKQVKLQWLLYQF
jgi:hypothetical protein